MECKDKILANPITNKQNTPLFSSPPSQSSPSFPSAQQLSSPSFPSTSRLSSPSFPSTSQLSSPSFPSTSQLSSPGFASLNSQSARSLAASPSTPSPIVLTPCAACKILRRRCVEKCILAPYFPPTDPYKFIIAHKVFGASNIIKFLQELPESQREAAVSSMVYEANARVRDPVYGCAGAISHLQKQVGELQAQLAKSQAELVIMQCQQRNLIPLICMEMAETQEPVAILQQQQFDDASCFLDDNDFGSSLEPLWA